MKEDFLTKKCRFDPVFTVLCALLFLVALFFFYCAYSVFCDERDIFVVNFFLVLGALHGLPAAACVVGIIRSSKAAALAQKLCVVGSTTISGAEFERTYGVKNAGKKIARLIRNEYLTGVTYDRRNDIIIFSNRLGPADGFKRAYTCPHCGAAGKLEPYASARCEYCGRAIESVLKF